MLLAWCCKRKLQIILAVNTNCYNSENYSETIHNILYVANYLHTNLP